MTESFMNVQRLMERKLVRESEVPGKSCLSDTLSTTYLRLLELGSKPGRYNASCLKTFTLNIQYLWRVLSSGK
jgi:hypothetical protein